MKKLFLIMALSNLICHADQTNIVDCSLYKPNLARDQIQIISYKVLWSTNLVAITDQGKPVPVKVKRVRQTYTLNSIVYFEEWVEIESEECLAVRTQKKSGPIGLLDK